MSFTSVIPIFCHHSRRRDIGTCILWAKNRERKQCHVFYKLGSARNGTWHMKETCCQEEVLSQKEVVVYGYLQVGSSVAIV